MQEGSRKKRKHGMQEGSRRRHPRTPCDLLLTNYTSPPTLACVSNAVIYGSVMGWSCAWGQSCVTLASLETLWDIHRSVRHSSSGCCSSQSSWPWSVIIVRYILFAVAFHVGSSDGSNGMLPDSFSHLTSVSSRATGATFESELVMMFVLPYWSRCSREQLVSPPHAFCIHTCPTCSTQGILWHAFQDFTQVPRISRYLQFFLQHRFQNYSIHQCVTREEIFIKELLAIMHLILIVEKQPVNLCYTTLQSPLWNDNHPLYYCSGFFLCVCVCELSWEEADFSQLVMALPLWRPSKSCNCSSEFEDLELKRLLSN